MALIKKLALIKKIFVVLCFEKLLWFMGLGPPVHGHFLILKIKMEKKVMSVKIDNKI